MARSFSLSLPWLPSCVRIPIPLQHTVLARLRSNATQSAATQYHAPHSTRSQIYYIFICMNLKFLPSSNLFLYLPCRVLQVQADNKINKRGEALKEASI